MLELIFGMELLPALCFLFGFICVIVEIFYPGFGVPGIVGSILLFVGVIIVARTTVEALILILIILAILSIFILIAYKSASSGRLKKMVLGDSLNRESGYVGTSDLSRYIGMEGKVLTTLRPAGMADFNGEKIDVVSEGEFISKGATVKVTRVAGRQVVVKKSEETK